jgi:hypothetical protein
MSLTTVTKNGNLVTKCDNCKCNAWYIWYILENGDISCKYCYNTPKSITPFESVSCLRCGDLLISLHDNDFKWCKGHHVAVNGGLIITNDKSCFVKNFIN